MENLTPVTFEEYIILSNQQGLYNLFDIEQSYRMYLAYMSGNPLELEKAIKSAEYNYYFKLNGRFN